MTYGTQNFSTQTLEAPTTSTNPLATDAQRRQHALDNKMPPELAHALGDVSGNAGFSRMPLADQVAALRAIDMEHLAEMNQNLLDQGLSQQEVDQNLRSYAVNQMGMSPNTTSQDLDILLSNYYNGTIDRVTDEQDHYTLEPPTRQQELIAAYIDGIDNRLAIGEGITKEEIEEFARRYHLSATQIEDELEDRGIAVEDKPNIPGQGLIKTGLALETVSMVPGMG